MAFKSSLKDYVLSSTPFQSPEDSGYFGSCHRRYSANSKVLHSCSPINESTLRNFPEGFSLKDEFGEVPQQIKFEKSLLKNESLSSLEVNELSELEFTNSNFSGYGTSPSEEQKFHDLLYNSYKDSGNRRDSFNSLSEDSDIKYNLFEFESSDFTNLDDVKYSKSFSNELSAFNACLSRNINKQVKIDFIHELAVKNCFSIISFILSCLSAKELCIASCINKEWNEVILHDSKANTRRQDFITERTTFLNGPSKENRKGMKYGPAKEHKNAFSDLTNLTTAHPVTTKASSKFDSFIKEAQNTKSKLMKCPRCFHASKCLNGNNYSCTHCSYNFCTHCLEPIVKTHSCFKRRQVLNNEKNDIVVGSRRSKKNLKRL